MPGGPTDDTQPASADTIRSSPKVAHVTPEPGTKLGRYELRRLIGTGGMGQVFEAHDTALDRAVALKVLRPGIAADENELAERLLRESRIMAKVVHRSVITVFDVGREGDAVFLAMELVRGTTLGGYLAREQPYWRDIVELFEHAGQGLAAAHAVGIIHRDFKPENVLVELDGERATRVVVTDFGIARAAQEVDLADGRSGRLDMKLTSTGTVLGTPAYMAPEQLDGKDVDVRADVFAFAASLWEALFDERPYRGATIAEIRAAMATPPKPPHHGVPRRLVRALVSALAVDPRDRWPAMMPLLRELAAVRLLPRRIAIGVGAVALIGLGTAGAIVARPAAEDPCSRGLAALASAYGPERRAEVAQALAANPEARDDVLARLDLRSAAWRATLEATCQAHAPTTLACLDARRLELDAIVSDLVGDGPLAAKWARPLVELVGDPSACEHASLALGSARVPENRVLQYQVALLRYRMYEAGERRARGELDRALPLETAIVADAAKVWPPVHAEALLLLGATRAEANDEKAAVATLHEAAAEAEAAHDDHLAALSWLQLGSSAYDRGDADGALEYSTYAQAAADRLGDPSELEARIDYLRGISLVELGRTSEAEPLLRRAVDIARTRVPDRLPQALQGLAILYETLARYPEAVAALREALSHLDKHDAMAASTEVAIRVNLASDLSSEGQVDEAEAVARAAVAITDRQAGARYIGWAGAHLALVQVLEDRGERETALAEIRRTEQALALLRGEHNEEYSQIMLAEADLLADLGRYDEAEQQYLRACDRIASATGDGSAQEAECWARHSFTLLQLGRAQDAIELVDKAMTVFEHVYGADHPKLANLLITRGGAHAKRGEHAAAVADFERAIVLYDKASLDPGYAGSAAWQLGQELWPRDPVRARKEIEDAHTRFEHAGPSWQAPRDEVARWLRSH